MRDSSVESLLTIQEAMDALKCSRAKIYTLSRAKQLKIVKLGNRSSRVTESSLVSLLRKLTRDDEPSE